MPAIRKTRNQTLTQIAIVTTVGAILAITLYFGSVPPSDRLARTSPATQTASQPQASTATGYFNSTPPIDATTPVSYVVEEYGPVDDPDFLESHSADFGIVYLKTHIDIDNTDPETKAFLHSRQFAETMGDLSPRGTLFPPDIRGAPGDPNSLPPQATIID